MQAAPRLPLTERCLHYEDLEDVPEQLQKYFHQRYSLFSKYDDGIQMTDDAWFGVTPEPVANQISEDLFASADDTKTTLVDLFGGVGGNAIAFARSGKWERVIAVEKDAATLACAQHNAEVHGCGDGLITWVHADCFDFLKATTTAEGVAPGLRLVADQTILFASPPWGGVDYRDQEVFDLSTMQPYGLAALNEACRAYDHVLYLPRTSDLRQIAKLGPKDDQIEVVQYCMMGASKAMVAYISAEAGALGRQYVSPDDQSSSADLLCLPRSGPV